jgi:ankyrin repeat protein
MRILRNYLKIPLYGLVFVWLSLAHAGSYDDFFKAIIRDDPRSLSRLIARGFDPNTPAPDLRHGLMMALSLPEPSVLAAQALVNAPGTNLNVRNAQGETPLMLAALKGQLALAAQMIERGADVNQPGWTPLHYAATGGSPAMVELMLKHHAFVDAESPNGTTPLMMAAQYGSPEALKLLLEAGAQPQQRNQQGLRALEFAQRGSRPDALKILGAALRAQAPRGRW